MPADPTRWTIWLAMAAYVAALALGLCAATRTSQRKPGAADSIANPVSPCLPLSLSPGLDQSRTEHWQRTFWTLACLLTWVHVLCAFALHHHWSHAAAFVHTADETARKVGIAWGGGIYFNYVFLALWSADAIWWWWRPASYRHRSRRLSIFVHAYLAFIAINATVIFESGPIRYAALAAIAGLAIIAAKSRRFG